MLQTKSLLQRKNTARLLKSVLLYTKLPQRIKSELQPIILGNIIRLKQAFKSITYILKVEFMVSRQQYAVIYIFYLRVELYQIL